MGEGKGSKQLKVDESKIPILKVEEIASKVRASRVFRDNE
jgi:hypothetical protein